MIEINLIPDVKQELLHAERMRTAVIAGSIVIAIISIGIVVLLSLYIFLVQNVRSAIDDSSITSGSKKLLAVTDLSKTLTLQNQLSKIDSLNGQKNLYSRTFGMLSAVIPPAPNDVSISEFDIDSASTTITLNGQATNSYPAVEIFKKTIAAAEVKYTDSDGVAQEEPLASDISISNTSYGADATGAKVLEFTLSFTYSADFYSPGASNVSVVIGTSGNVTDSNLGVPNSIFAAKATSIVGGQ